MTDINERITQLKKLKSLIKENEPRILRALKADLGKCSFEGYSTEVGFVLEEINHYIKNLKSWAKPQSVGSSLLIPAAGGKIYLEPYGHVLIIAPWNYPFQLVMAPAVAAIAAGNRLTLKPSELAPYTAEIVNELVSSWLPIERAQVVLGGVEATQELLNKKHDYIFFTGSTRVGKIIMEKASAHLTPVTLELGGKSPCIVDASADISVAARRIVWGKFMNAGQTCVAPDYLLVQDSVKDELVEKIKNCIRQFYGDDPQKSSEYGRIINVAHFDRLMSYMRSGELVCGGQSDAAEKYIAPTVLDGVSLDSKVMSEEIFGPILPVLTYKNESEVFDIVGQFEKPLALYLFSNSSQFQNTVLKRISFGGGCINDTLMHLGLLDLPFGGVGHSGMGSYHGRYGFECFSHKKSLLTTPTWLDPSLRYPPYGNKLKLLKMLMGR